MIGGLATMALQLATDRVSPPVNSLPSGNFVSNSCGKLLPVNSSLQFSSFKRCMRYSSICVGDPIFFKSSSEPYLYGPSFEEQVYKKLHLQS